MNREVIVVLGMHRSGTSAVARGLKALGVQLGDHLIGPGADNPRGFWENKDIININITLLSILGLQWDSLRLISPSQWQNPYIRQLKPKAAQVIQENLNSFHLWGFKDPRTLRVLPFWIEVFNQLQLTTKYLMVVRNPLSVARSLYYRDHIPPKKSHLLWSIYVIPHLTKIRCRPLTVIDYDLLMDNPILQLRKIASRLQLPESLISNSEMQNYADAFLSQGLRHSQYSEEDVLNDTRVNDLTVVAYQLLHRLADDEAGLGPDAFWQEWSALETALHMHGPDGHYIEQRKRPYDPRPHFGKAGGQFKLPMVSYRLFNGSTVRGDVQGLSIVRRWGTR